MKHYPEKRGIVHNEILLPANAPPEYADRNTLWNAAEAVEKQWNSQLARRWCLPSPERYRPTSTPSLSGSFVNSSLFQEAKNRCFRILADYLHLLMAWRTDYAPHSPEEAFHTWFVEALQKQSHVEYLLDVLLFGETEEKEDLIMDCGKDVIQLEQRMAELAAPDAARTKKHHERHAVAPERP